MQYFKPTEDKYFAGDCMPFFHDGVFHLFYLQDENHHAALGGLGGHQWAHATTTDLVNWTHHPLAIAITNDWEFSICTGSTFYHAGTYYGFYATRKEDWSQHLSLATSTDGITFHKTEPNPFASPLDGYHRDSGRLMATIATTIAIRSCSGTSQAVNFTCSSLLCSKTILSTISAVAWRISLPAT